jgi:uncharacterized protein (DUF1499 family)
VRRRLAVEPFSQLAIWARRFASFSVATALLSIIILRSGLLEIVPALATFAGALILALVAILLALAALVVIWRQGLRGTGYAVTALGLGLLLLAYPGYLSAKAYKLPAVADITTDPLDPPRFEAIARLRTREANPVQYAGLRAAELQRSAYPDIEPLEVAATPQIAFQGAYSVMEKRRWRIVDARAPETGRREGRIEAVARTPVMGFRDDVVLRVRTTPDGARIDVRSASRYGYHDFGTNASRVSALLTDINDAVDVLLEKENKKEKKPELVKGAQAPARSTRR